MKVLFIRFSSLGDIILTTGAIKYFKTNFPDANIHVLTYSQFAQLYEGLEFIDKIIPLNRDTSFVKYLSFVKQNSQDYDYIIDLHSNLRSKLFALTLGKNYLHYNKLSLKRRLFTKYRLFKNDLRKHVVERYFNILKDKFNMTLSNPESLEEIRPFIKQYAKMEKGRIVLHPFASKKAKEWPYFNVLATKLLSHGFNIVIVGKGKFDKISGITDKTNKTSLKELLTELSKAELVITTDSGPMHAAVALNKKTVAIFGPTTKEFGFYPIFENCKIVENTTLECRPCHVHGLNLCPKKHFKCMQEISADTVLNTSLELLKK